jgi:hypothetical protein
MGGGLLWEFFLIAKRACANYGSNGPNGKLDYCYPGPHSCVLKDDKFCAYFDRVIGYKPFRDQGLRQKWRELWEGAPERIINKLCVCGEEFRPTGRRQKYCPKCQKLSQREKTRLRMRKMRNQKKIRKGSGVTLYGHF